MANNESGDRIKELEAKIEKLENRLGIQEEDSTH